jgi:hypothetical protein
MSTATLWATRRGRRRITKDQNDDLCVDCTLLKFGAHIHKGLFPGFSFQRQERTDILLHGCPLCAARSKILAMSKQGVFCYVCPRRMNDAVRAGALPNDDPVVDKILYFVAESQQSGGLITST